MPRPNLNPYPNRTSAGFQACESCESVELHWTSRKGSVICGTCGKTMTRLHLDKIAEEAKLVKGRR